jgi:hypothetical protein
MSFSQRMHVGHGPQADKDAEDEAPEYSRPKVARTIDILHSCCILSRNGTVERGVRRKERVVGKGCCHIASAYATASVTGRGLT